MQVATRKMNSMIFFYIIVNIIIYHKIETSRSRFTEKLCYPFLHINVMKSFLHIIEMKSTMKWVDSNQFHFLDVCIVN